MVNFKTPQPLVSLGLILVFMIVSSFTQSNNIDPVHQKEIDDLITNWYLPTSNTSKLALAIVQDNGEVLYSTGYGMADEEKGIPNSNQTQFVIGSATKSVTSVVVIKVLHEMFPEMGEAVLDVPIIKLLPSVNFTLMDRFRSEHISFRDLIAHRTCLFGETLQLLAEPFNTTEEIIYRQRYGEEKCAVRSEFQYHNQMYIAAGDLIGMLVNKTYTQLVNELLEDLGMDNSALAQYSDDFSNMPYRAQPYYVIDGVSYPGNTQLQRRVVPYNAAGGLFATPNDMIKYLRFHLNKGSIDGKQIIPEEVMAWITKPSITVRDALRFKTSDDDLVTNSFGYGLGLMTASYDGWQYLHHSGYFPPYASLVSLFPEKKLGVFTTSNEAPALASVAVIHTFIFDLLRGVPNAAEKAIKEWNKTNAWTVKDGETDIWLKSSDGEIAIARWQEEIKREKELKQKRALDKLIKKVRATGTVRVRQEDVIGKYGHGNSGDLEVFEKFNSETGIMELHLTYGNWHNGRVLQVIEGLPMYQFILENDSVQDVYAAGQLPGWRIAVIADGTLEFYDPLLPSEEYVLLARFKLGVSLDILPPIPWSTDSCGPEL